MRLARLTRAQYRTFNSSSKTLPTNILLNTFFCYRYTVEQLQKSNLVKKSFVISKVGDYVLFISHLHGFWVSFDQFGDVKIGVSTKYLSSVDGLCGFFNENPVDDKRLPTGEQAKSTLDFGDSWYVDQISKDNCEPHVCPTNLQDAAWEMCNLIKEESFKPCVKAVDIDRFVSKCLETACDCLKGSYGSNQPKGSVKGSTEAKACKCSMLQNFVVECMSSAENIQLDTWRSVHSCESACPAPLVHKDCYRRRCEPSFENLDSEACPFLPGTCFSGCYCPEGTVRKGEICIPMSECRDCICDGFGKSSYLTYDRSNFTFDGNCTYLLSRDLKIDNKHTFQTYVTLGPCESTSTKTKTKQFKSGSCTQSLHVVYGSHIIHIQKSKVKGLLDILVDGMKLKSLPFNEKWIKITEVQGREMKLLLPESQVELTTLFDDMSFSIKVPSLKYGAKLEGLCGDCDKDPNNDFKPNKKKINENKIPTGSVQEFAESWLADEPKLELNEEQCEVKEESEIGCIATPPDKDPCFKLLDEKLFGKCHLVVDPYMYVSSCQQDMCQTGTSQKGACEFISAYARKCSSNGICLDWRSNQLCPMECSSHLTYSPCGCPETCESVKAKNNLINQSVTKKSNTKLASICSVPQIEGCFCPKGSVLRNGKCIPERECNPCDDKAGHYQGDKWYPDKCTDCECKLDGKVVCAKKECSITETICQKGFKPVEVPKADECCSKFMCVPEPKVPAPLTCPESLLPQCGPGQYKKMEVGSDGCTKYICGKRIL